MLNALFVEGFGTTHHKHLVNGDETTLTYLAGLCEAYIRSKQASQIEKASIFHFMSFIDLTDYDPTIRHIKTDFETGSNRMWTFLIVKWIHFFWNRQESILPHLYQTLHHTKKLFSKNHVEMAIKITEQKFRGIPEDLLSIQWRNLHSSAQVFPNPEEIS
ncbi:MAG: hypothetical protein ACTSRE_13190 [Promethearchaeota archaeon]